MSCSRARQIDVVCVDVVELQGRDNYAIEPEKERCMSRASRIVNAILLLLLGLASVTPALAEEEKPTANASVAFLSQYIWRGQELSHHSLVIQPSMTVSYLGASANVWSNLDTDYYVEDSNSLNETDLTLSYSHNLGSVNLTGGYIYYGLDSVPDAQEVFLTAALNILLQPTLTVYREFSHYHDWYIAGGIGHSFTLPYKMTLDLRAQAAYLLSESKSAYPEFDSEGNPKDEKFNNFHDGTLTAALNVPAGKYFTVSPQISYTFPLSGDASDEMKARSVNGNDDQFIYGGLVVSFAF
jgi:hypothetical protein